MDAAEFVANLTYTQQVAVRLLVAPRLGISPDEEAAVDALRAVSPELEAAVRDWWQSASFEEVLWFLFQQDDRRVFEVACLLAAELNRDASSDPRVAECRAVRRAWVLGEATDDQRRAARDSISSLVFGVDPNPAARAAWAVAFEPTRDALRPFGDEARAALFRCYPDPLRINPRAALAAI